LNESHWTGINITKADATREFTGSWPPDPRCPHDRPAPPRPGPRAPGKAWSGMPERLPTDRPVPLRTEDAPSRSAAAGRSIITSGPSVAGGLPTDVDFPRLHSGNEYTIAEDPA
jgi:hypothetical protein